MTEAFQDIPPEVRSSFTFQELPNGTIRITRTRRGMRYQFGRIVFAALFANGLTAIFALAFLEFIPGSLTYEPVGLLLFGPFWLLLGGGAAVNSVWKAFGKEQWRVEKNLFEWQGRLFGWHRLRGYRDCRLRVRQWGPGWDPFLTIPRGESSWLIHRDLFGSPDIEAVLWLGRLLSERTGWPLLVEDAPEDGKADAV